MMKIGGCALPANLWKTVGWCFLLILGSKLSAQEKIAPNLLRDTIYHKSGITYKGVSTDYEKIGRTRLRDASGRSMRFDNIHIDHIGWSDRSRVRFIEETVSLDTIETIDVVYLKDGSIFRGEILEYERGAFLRFLIKSGPL